MPEAWLRSVDFTSILVVWPYSATDSLMSPSTMVLATAFYSGDVSCGYASDLPWRLKSSTTKATKWEWVNWRQRMMWKKWGLRRHGSKLISTPYIYWNDSRYLTCAYSGTYRTLQHHAKNVVLPDQHYNLLTSPKLPPFPNMRFRASTLTLACCLVLATYFELTNFNSMYG